ncbi:MAG: hypothetical protein IE936_06720, partial [Moraxella osloensis]|nr:hypothetical protein [Moraxella osloensis]
PLAHIGIKEQTMMTLVMMCLANQVETQQGDPSTDYEEVHAKKIVSYGNRIYCTYRDDKAEHSYGATTVYSKFFQDYQTFLQRPYYFANRQLTEKAPDEEVYLVELDLRQFFDCVDRKKLTEKIQELTPSIKGDKKAQSLLGAFESWSWSEECKNNFDVCKSDVVEKLPQGIPQGLVAGGFLANIYLLDFDADISSFIGKTLFSFLHQAEIKLIDYCRYVDDMRLVLVGPKRNKDKENHPNPAEEIKAFLNCWFNAKLKPLNLVINDAKIKVEIYRGKSVGISKQLQEIQSAVSGPVSFEDAQEQLTQLESLLSICPQKEIEQDGAECRLNRLVGIEKSIFDVRDDTLRRFAANKISRTLNTIRHFTAREIDESNQAVPGDWDYLQERMARRLIAVWSRDPSLVLLLKKGLELFPSPKLLEPILEQFDAVFSKSSLFDDLEEIKQLKQKAVMCYLLSEVFRHSATVIHKKDPQAIPAQADVEGFFEKLQDCAINVLNNPSTSWLLKEQAQFLLLVRLDTVLESSTGVSQQDLIFKLAKGFRNITLPAALDSKQLAHSIIIASQLIEEQKPLIRAANSIFNNSSVKDITPLQTLKYIAYHDTGLVKSLVKSARAHKQAWIFVDEIKTLMDRLYLDSQPSRKPLDKITQPMGLLQLITREDNPFANEIMALKLMQALLGKHAEIEKDIANKVIDLALTKVEFGCGYANPPKYEQISHELKISQLKYHDSVFEQASHLKLESEQRTLQQIALVIRAALSSSQDVTGFGQAFEPKTGYRGVKSTQYKRQFGLYTTPQALAGETAAFSSWLATLLHKLLKWPGIRVNDRSFDWPELTLENVTKLVEERLEKLKTHYCQLSQMPTVIETIQPDWQDKTELTIAMVQSKLPHKADFATAGLLLDKPNYRVKHRRHVARVSQLVLKHIEAQRTEHTDKDNKKNHIDLIIWPELSVHLDDLDILKHLAQKTHAIVLAGIGFEHQPSIKGPNNRAVWIVPKKHNGNQNELIRYQGKYHMMKDEREAGVQSWRPYQFMIELLHSQFPKANGFKLTAAICYDATDIKLSADLAEKSNAFLIPALNTDVSSFDAMVEALHYHMYQPVVLVNTGEYGGSYAMAPYKERHHRLIAHATGAIKYSKLSIQH